MVLQRQEIGFTWGSQHHAERDEYVLITLCVMDPRIAAHPLCGECPKPCVFFTIHG